MEEQIKQEPELSEFHKNINELAIGSEENKTLAAKLLLSEEATMSIILNKYESLKQYLDNEEQEVLLRKQLHHFIELEKQITLEIIKDGENIPENTNE
jgi:hypothetical protein